MSTIFKLVTLFELSFFYKIRITIISIYLKFVMLSNEIMYVKVVAISGFSNPLFLFLSVIFSIFFLKTGLWFWRSN